MPGPIWNMCHNALSANLNAGRAALIIRIKMYIYVAAVKLRRCDKIWFSFSLPGFEWVLVHGDPTSQFLGIGWISVWVLVWRVPRPGKFWQLDNVQSRSMLPQDAIGSAERFFALLRTTHAYNLTCLLLIHQVRVSVLGVHCIGFHEFKA